MATLELIKKYQEYLEAAEKCSQLQEEYENINYLFLLGCVFWAFR